LFLASIPNNYKILTADLSTMDWYVRTDKRIMQEIMAVVLLAIPTPAPPTPVAIQETSSTPTQET
jgi:hypothetical protein